MMKDYYEDEFGKTHSFLEGYGEPKPLTYNEVKSAVKEGVLEALGMKKPESKYSKDRHLDSEIMEYLLEAKKDGDGLSNEELKDLLNMFYDIED